MKKIKCSLKAVVLLENNIVGDARCSLQGNNKFNKATADFSKSLTSAESPNSWVEG